MNKIKREGSKPNQALMIEYFEHGWQTYCVAPSVYPKRKKDINMLGVKKEWDFCLK